MQNRMFVMAAQAEAARQMLYDAGVNLGKFSLQGIREKHHLLGGHGTFVIVEGHRQSVPSEIMAAVEQLGMSLMVLDDRFSRAKAYERLDHVMGN